jgi:Lrp/AsnC family leucine-responsive transcriptional regulator
MSNESRIASLDDRDRAILALLQEDGRLSNLELAERVNLSPSACHRRVRLLEESGLIAGTVLLLDQEACGKPGTAFVEIKLERQDRQALDAFEAVVATVPEVLDCYLVAGPSDYLIRTIFADAAEFERIHTEILTRLPGVVRVETVFTLRTVKRTTRIPL